jgi:glucosamine 6-phosphate synthetase-like amidotransferase/phosphosugar isomerase protein
LKNWKTSVEPAVDFLRDSPYTVILGRGPGRASAMFTAVLFREVPKIVAEGMGAAVFRHGLREMIRPEHRVVIFAPEGNTHELLINLAKELLEANIPVLIVTNRTLELGTQYQHLVIQLDPLPEFWAPLLDMVPLQLAGYRLAEVYGLEPGKLVISSYVTTEE